MRITADTNLLVRAAVPDGASREDAAQARRARAALAGAEIVAVPATALCEFAWVLARVYGYGRADVAAAIRRLVGSANAVCEASVVEAGLATLEAGGDFAAGAIAAAGTALGGDIFLSFDRKAVRLLRDAGQRAEEPA